MQQSQRIVPAYSSGGDTSALPSPEWLKRFWAFVGHDNMHLFNAWPVVLLTSGALASVAAMSEVLNLPQALPAYMPPYPDVDSPAQVRKKNMLRKKRKMDVLAVSDCPGVT
jgi:hypothetical protein